GGTMTKIEPRYTTTVTATGGREGHAVSDDGVLDVQLRRPKTNGRSDGTTPEQLFAAAWAGCFQSALGAVARETGDDVSQSKVSVEVGIGAAPDGGSGLVAKIMVEIPGVNSDKAQELADKAHQLCPYSRATRGNIDVDVTVAQAV